MTTPLGQMPLDIPDVAIDKVEAGEVWRNYHYAEVRVIREVRVRSCSQASIAKTDRLVSIQVLSLRTAN